MPCILCLDCSTLRTADGPACPACSSLRAVSHPEIETLAIAHIDCDAFYASVEKRDRPELKDVPLIVGHPGGRGVVTTACYIARRSGVRSAMPMFRARELCPDAVVIAPDMAKYRVVSVAIREIIRAATQVIEPVSLDEAYLDLTGRLAEGRNPAALLATIARRVEGDVGLTVSVGLAPNKFLAKLASDLRKPRGFSVIGRAEAKAFLAPLPVAKIHGVGAATAARMAEMGLTTIADLQRLSAAELMARFGKFGRRLAQFAHGEDDRKVTSIRAAKSISAETTFVRDTADPARLAEAAGPLAERVAAQLQRKGVAAAGVVVKLKTADFRLLTRSRRLGSPTVRADVLLRSALPLIAREADGTRFRLIGIGAEGLVPASEADPPDLFGSGG